MAKIIVNGPIDGGIIKVGSLEKRFAFDGGFKKYKVVHMISRANGLGIENREFDEGMIGFGGLFQYCMRYAVNY